MKIIVCDECGVNISASDKQPVAILDFDTCEEELEHYCSGKCLGAKIEKFVTTCREEDLNYVVTLEVAGE